MRRDPHPYRHPRTVVLNARHRTRNEIDLVIDLDHRRGIGLDARQHCLHFAAAHVDVLSAAVDHVQ